ncbi:hypothetical protein QN224_30155 [Sinorhizobium sp. 8-89]|uniref:hypothetical protein n=1 Tax=Sinorhizobium sp. 7-81 TaxID=3049087 RepID=UPI0024C32146|nr:hypothetical protein [Sinorhizobium sp. 7-81]MDK1389640.1 hypothetical protein [Sinorhizobium sp. 7-81]
MRTPERRFVVEFKSGRQQQKARANSIWGDTDFKALAREVEEKVPHLFSSNEAPGGPGSAETAPADPTKAGSASEHADDVDIARGATPLTDGVEAEMPKQHEVEGPAAIEVAAQVEESQPISQPPTTPRAIPRKRTKRAPARAAARNLNVGRADRNAQTGAVKDPISLDELDALEADNKRLKRLLAEQLFARNARLKKMLARFDIS